MTERSIEAIMSPEDGLDRDRSSQSTGSSSSPAAKKAKQEKKDGGTKKDKGHNNNGIPPCYKAAMAQICRLSRDVETLKSIARDKKVTRTWTPRNSTPTRGSLIWGRRMFRSVRRRNLRYHRLLQWPQRRAKLTLARPPRN